MEDVDDLFPTSTSSESETEALGRRLAERLRPGDVVALFGQLGAGKTVLTKGLCAGLGVDAELVTSPTFTILHEYTTGRLPVYHFDAYRVERLEELFDLGYEDYFFNGGVCVVEWADKVDEILPAEALRIRINHEQGNARRIELAS